MNELTIALLVSLAGIVGNIYLYYLFFRKGLLRTAYLKEIDKYFEIMRQYGYKDSDIADMLFDHKTYQDLKDYNKQSSKALKKTDK